MTVNADLNIPLLRDANIPDHVPGPIQGNDFNGRIALMARGIFNNPLILNWREEMNLSLYKFAVGLAYSAVIGITLSVCAIIGVAVAHNPLLLAAWIATTPFLIAIVGAALTLAANYLLEKFRDLLGVDSIFGHRVFEEFYPEPEPLPVRIA